MSEFIGWPYRPKRFLARVSFFPTDGRRPVVKTVVKGMNLDMVRKKATKIARSFFLHDAHVLNADFSIDLVPLGTVPPSVYSQAGEHGQG